MKYQDRELKDRLSTFRKSTSEMIATSQSSYSRYGSRYSEYNRDYTKEEVQNIIEHGTLEEQQRLSRCFFDKNSYYRRIIIMHATLLKYVGLLIPNVNGSPGISADSAKKKYNNALNYIEKMNLPNFLMNCSLRALIDGCYYGVIQKVDKNTFSTLDLPAAFCRTRFKDEKGNDIIEFNVRYFYTITDKDSRRACLKVYPKVLSRAFYRYDNGKLSDSWVFIPANIGICFPFYESNRPMFLDVIPAAMDYDDTVDNEKEKDLDEIKKILVQKVPHLTDGQLLFEPPEAEEMHKGAVGMLSGNKNIDVLTTYADVDAIVSKTTADSTVNNIEKMYNNIFYKAGVSGQLFASVSNLAIKYSLTNAMTMMTILVNKYNLFVTNIINSLYGNSSISFKYVIQPITYYNEEDFLDNSFKLAQNGYSLLLPALAMGMSQRDIVNIKDLENDVLNMTDKLRPPRSSYTQSNDSSDAVAAQGNADNGRPTLDPSEESDKTEKNQESLDRTGMVTSE